jgi:DNA replication protein DnaD
MRKFESIDELLININIDDFIQDCKSDISVLDLKRKYGINSNSSLNNLIKSLINLNKIKKNEIRISNSSKLSSDIISNEVKRHNSSGSLFPINKSNQQAKKIKGKRDDIFEREIDDILLGIYSDDATKDNDYLTSKTVSLQGSVQLTGFNSLL